MTKKLKFTLVGLVFLFALAYLLFAPHYWLCISHEGGTDMFLIPVGQKIFLSYIHSLERTPVQDVFLLQGGQIWLYEERVKSHNAGLPAFDQYPGSLVKTEDWLIFRGGRRHWTNIRCRVGNAAIGKNILTIGKTNHELYYRYPEQPVCLFVVLKSIL